MACGREATVGGALASGSARASDGAKSSAACTASRGCRRGCCCCCRRPAWLRAARWGPATRRLLLARAPCMVGLCGPGARAKQLRGPWVAAGTQRGAGFCASILGVGGSNDLARAARWLHVACHTLPTEHSGHCCVRPRAAAQFNGRSRSALLVKSAPQRAVDRRRPRSPPVTCWLRRTACPTRQNSTALPPACDNLRQRLESMTRSSWQHVTGRDALCLPCTPGAAHPAFAQRRGARIPSPSGRDPTFLGRAGALTGQRRSPQRVANDGGRQGGEGLLLLLPIAPKEPLGHECGARSRRARPAAPLPPPQTAQAGFSSSDKARFLLRPAQASAAGR